MNSQQLLYFKTVAKYLNYGQAARSLGMAQSAISYGISNLEKELNIRLFERDTRSVRLTAAGAFLLKELDGIRRDFDTAVERARNIEAGFAGMLRVAFLSSIIKRHYSEIIPPFQEKYPSAEIITGQLPMALLRESVINGTVDVGFTRLLDVENVPGLECRRLYSDRCCLVVHKSHPFAATRKIDYSVLADEPFVLLSETASPNWHNRVMEICRNRGFIPNITQVPYSMEAVYNLLEFGMGVGIMPSAQNLYNMPDMVLLELEPGEDTTVDVGAVWKRENVNPIIPVFISEISENFAGL